MGKILEKFISKIALSLYHFSSFTYLNITQFLGALNDNIFKFLIIFLLIDLKGQENAGSINAVAGFIFVLPFIVFSAATGKLADRYSKSHIIRFSKILELIVMAFGVVAFTIQSVWGAYILLFLMAAQSAIFGPSKYGIVPEIVSSDKISEANGLLSCFTFLAIILGSAIGTYVTDVTGKNFILGAIFCTLVAFTGVLTSLYIEYTPPAGSRKEINFLFWNEIYISMKRSLRVPHLLPAMLGSAYFMFIGSYMQLNIMGYGIESLGLTPIQGGYLFVLTAIGIGMGSVLCGKLSGKAILLGAAPLALFLMALTCFCLHFFSSHLFGVIFLLVFSGMFGGIYVVPLDSFIQARSPDRWRGQMIAAANVLSFIGVLISAGTLMFFTQIGIRADQGFFIVGVITFLVAILLVYLLAEHVLHITSRLMNWAYYHVETSGEDLPENSGALALIQHRHLMDLMVLMSTQPRPVRFFNLYKPLKFFGIRLAKKYSKESLRRALRRGVMVCLLVHEKISEEDKHMLRRDIDELQEQADYPIIPIHISSSLYDEKSAKKTIQISFGSPQDGDILNILTFSDLAN